MNGSFNPLFVFLQSCQADLVKDNGHKYFLSVLADPYMPVSRFIPLDVNSLVPGRCDCNLKLMIFKLISSINILSI